jgi:signal transduction histidine kinase
MGIKLIIESTEAVKKMIDLMKNLSEENNKSMTTLEKENNSIIETASLINESCNVALETLSEMLTFDKLDENKLVLELGKYNPWSLVRDAMMPFRINAANAQVNLSADFKPTANRDIESPSSWVDEYMIDVDKFKLQQVLRNLISNAIKFTPPHGKVKILLEMLPMDLFKSKLEQTEQLCLTHFLRISVIDSGYGISKDDQKKLFGQYVQFNANELQQGKGSGLGLWIARSIMII